MILVLKNIKQCNNITIQGDNYHSIGYNRENTERFQAMIYSDTLENAIAAINEGLDLFENADIEDRGESVITEYKSNPVINLQARIVGKLNLLDTWLASQFKTTVDLYEYWENAGNHFSRDRIKVWDIDPDNYNDTDFIEMMLDMLDDNFGYLFAAQMQGCGVGLWELFDKDMPDLFCIC